MARYSENQLFKELANRYIEHYGEMLEEETTALTRPETPYITPRMDSRIRQAINPGRGKRRYAMGIVAAAAMLLLMLPVLVTFYQSDRLGHESTAPAADAEQAVPSVPAQKPPLQAPEILPLNFALPSNLTVADSKLDNGKSVYYLLNSELDHIVMTMEMNPQENVFAGLKEMQLSNSTVYYKYATDFSMMAFERQGITYVLTCKYDVNTLVPLAEAIL